MARVFAVVAWCFFTTLGFLQAQTHQGVELVEARLIADSETIVPGRPVTLGLHLKMAPGWHTYWEYSGDAGLPTLLELELPDGFRATKVQWPLPERFSEEGGIDTYGYKGEVLLLVRLFPPAKLDLGEVEVSGRAEWLVCEKTCLPGQARLSLKLAVADQLKPVNAGLFQRFQQQLPRSLRAAGGIEAKWERRGKDFILAVTGAEGASYDFYPLPPRDVIVGRPEKTAAAPGGTAGIHVPVTAPPAGLLRLPGVLVVEDAATGERRGWSLP